MRASATFLLPFGSFSIVEARSYVASHGQTFLLPFGSFVFFVYVFRVCYELQLSTPFWEFPPSDVGNGNEGEYGTFYSLLGVSKQVLASGY